MEEMNDMIDCEYEYELIDFTWSLDYDFREDEIDIMVRDDEGTADEESAHIEFDENGIPKGKSREEIKMRKAAISQFMNQWSKTHNQDKRVLNEVLQEYIYVNGLSVVEMIEHSSKSYKSTLAALMFEEILKKAYPIRRVPLKEGNSNQSTFAFMLIMVYKKEDLGTIKLTIGVKSDRNASQIEKALKKYQYGITVLEGNEPLIKHDLYKKRKAPHKK